MDKGTRIILLVLGVLSILSIITAVRFFFLERSTYHAYVQMETKLTEENTQLSETLSVVQKEKTELKSQLDSVKKGFDKLSRDFDRITKENEDAGKRLKEALTENKDLEKEVKELTKERASFKQKLEGGSSDSFVAGLLKERAELEVEVNSLNDKMLSQKKELEKAIQDNKGLELRLNEVVKAKNEIESQIGKDEALADTLSRDLVKEQKSRLQAEARMEVIKKENAQLQVEMEGMRNAQGALEAKIAKFETKLREVESEKNGLTQKIADLNNEIELKLDEINEVKAMLDRIAGEKRVLASSGDNSPPPRTSNREMVELPPIIVKADASSSVVNPSPVTSIKSEPGDWREVTADQGNSIEGRVIVVNEEHAFVVIDKGKQQGVEIGMAFQVFRRDEEIGLVETIETRERIAACEIIELIGKNQVQTGDIVRRSR